MALLPSTSSNLPNIVEQLALAGKISAPVVTLKLPSVDGIGSGFALFGDPSAMLANKTSVTLENATSNGSWQFEASPKVNGRTLFSGDTKRTVGINTNLNEILIPADDMQTLISSIPDAQGSDGGFALPCNATTDISFEINGKQFTLLAANFISNITTSTSSNYCFARIGTQDGPVWDLGSPFTSKCY